MKFIGYTVTLITIAVYGVIMKGWALVKLWAWFIAPALGLPPLNIPQAIGLVIVINYVTREYESTESKEKKELWERLVEQVTIYTLKPLLALGVGWIVKLWM